MLRLSWTQPEDVLPHALVAARLDGVDVDDIERRWIDAGGAPSPPVTGASAEPATNELRALARQLLTAVDDASVPAGLLAAEPDDLGAIEQLAPGRAATASEADRDRLLGAWLGRAAGCLLGKPVEKIPRPGIRAIAESTGNWPISGYFTARGLDPDVATAYPWNRRSAVNSLVENIDGMPEDDDLNFPLVALVLAEKHGDAITTEDVAALWLDELPAGRVFTAERVAYRNLLEGEEPAFAGRVANPFQDWIGAQIRTDVYGWICPGDPVRAARLAWHDGRLTHHRNGLYGAMFVAAACSVAVTGASVGECIDAGLSVVPHSSRYAAAIRRGAALGESGSSLDDALDELSEEFGHLHWVHVLNNATLVAFALMRSGGDFAAGVTTVVAGGWDTDSNGATVGSICGAITGAANLPADWVAPLRNRLHSSIRGFDGVSFDELADRTAAARLPAADPPPPLPDSRLTNDQLLHPRPIDLPTTLPLDGPIDRAAADGAKIFAAPDDPADWPRWRERLVEWRHAARERWPYDDDAYTRPSAHWAAGCFSVALVWLWDERLFDHSTQRFDVDAFLDRTADFGGFDAVVLWQAYPIIGIDERTQFDFYRDVPGIAEVVREFQEHGVKVFVDYNPWDTATSAAADHPKLVAELVADLGVDGVFLDTMSEGGAALRASLAALPEPPVLEGESKVSLERIADHQLSWAQWFADSTAPGVLRARWFERRHMLHHTRRWNRDHSDELQSSWMNGVGMLVWDAIFGSWVGWNERDRATLRAMVRAQRVLADVLTQGEWTPLTDATPAAIDAGVYLSRFELGPIRIWTVVNRGDADYTGPVLDAPARSASSWFEVTGGAVLAGSRAPITVPARSVTGILAIEGDVPTEIQTMLHEAATDRRSSDSAFPVRLPERTVVARSTLLTPDPSAVVVAPGRYEVTVTSRLRETGLYDGAPFVEAWKPLPPLLHSEIVESHVVDCGGVAVAASDVSNDEFATFVDATGYRPEVANRFAAQWSDGRPVSGSGDAPMTFVDLADAEAYAAWRGARLPTEFEWQLAASDPGFERLEPLVWNLTAGVYSDGITRFVMVKGGSAYEPGHAHDEVEGVDPSLSARSIDWYFDGGRRDPSFSAKLLIAGMGLTRSSRLGFRLAWDLQRAEEVDDG